MRARRKQSEAGVELNMTPLIDMIFILLIFFMVTSSFVRESGIDVDRPVANTAEARTPGLVISIDAANVVWIDGETVDIRNVKARMTRFHTENPEGSVVIAADTMTRSGTTIRVLDACREAGVRNVSVAARREE